MHPRAKKKQEEKNIAKEHVHELFKQADDIFTQRPDLAHRYVDKLVDIDAHLERLRLALAATPERRYRSRVSEADDDDKTRVRRVPTTKYRAVG